MTSFTGTTESGVSNTLYFQTNLPDPSTGTRHALLVGIDNYSPVVPLETLYSCVNDIHGIKDTLLLGDPAGRWPSANIQELTNTNATASNIRHYFQQLSAQAGPDDIVLYAHSSHGASSFLYTYDEHYTSTQLGLDLALFNSTTKVIVYLDACWASTMYGQKSSPHDFVQSVLESYNEAQNKKSTPKSFGANIAFMVAAGHETAHVDGYYSSYTHQIVNSVQYENTDFNSNGEFEFSEIQQYAVANLSNQTPMSYNDALLQSVPVRSVTMSGSTLAVSPSTHAVPYSGGTTPAFDVITTASWDAASNQSWATVNNGASTGGGSFSVTCTANDTGNPRSATITVTGTGTNPSSVQVTVTQLPIPSSPSLNVTPSTQAVPADGGTTSAFNVTTSAVWSAASNQSWATVNDGSSTGGNSSFTVTCTFNDTGNPRTATITVTGTDTSPASVQVTITQTQLPSGGLEGDVAPRPDGDNLFKATDSTQAGRFVVGLDVPATGSEFQRADCAPRATSGDGMLAASDWVQVRRFVVGLDVTASVGGPTEPAAKSDMIDDLGSEWIKVASDRQISIPTVIIPNGQQDSISVVLDAQGDENAVSFSLRFDTTKLTYVSVTKGSDVPADGTLTINDSQAANGRLGILLGLNTGGVFAAGQRELVQVTFAAATGATTNQTTISFANQPAAESISDANANDLTADYVDGMVTISGPATTREVQVVNTAIQSNASGTVSIELVAEGDENAVSFSLQFDTARLTYVSAAKGADVPADGTFTVNDSLAAQGKLGFLIGLNTGATFAPGSREIVKVTFSAASVSTSTTTPLSFGNNPAVRSVSDVSAIDLLAGFVNGTVTVNPVTQPSLDVTPTSRSVGATAGSTTFTVATTAAWTASSNQGWATVTPTSGTGSQTLTVNYTANTGAQRTATITVTGTGTNPASKQVTVVQAAPSSGTGSIKVSIEPSAARSGGARWRVDGGSSTFYSGETRGGYAVGTHTVSFTDVLGYITPATRDVTVNKDQTTAILVEYIPKTVTVPNVVGKTQSAAQTAITSAGLTVGTVTQEYHATVASGLVISQNPAANSSVATGSTVSLVVSKGPQPDLTVTPTQRSVNASAGSTTFTIATTAAWTAASNQGWATVT
ncbi:MAG: PASTA domain-containing protein, partial [Candidatus Hydrogenedentes bacterium]|nr:PASTA domain-containing protein [Candidatus Hydrogenedentota bacterium]